MTARGVLPRRGERALALVASMQSSYNDMLSDMRELKRLGFWLDAEDQAHWEGVWWLLQMLELDANEARRAEGEEDDER